MVRDIDLLSLAEGNMVLRAGSSSLYRPRMPTESASLSGELEADRLSFDEIPVIDLTGLTASSTPPDLVDEIRWALTHVGFFYVSNHGVSEVQMTSVFDASRALFDLPDSAKQRLHISRSGRALRGYIGHYDENTDPLVTRDFKEAFDFGAASEPVSPFYGPNVWPEELPELEEVLMAYLDSMLDLSRRLLTAIALSLGLQPDYFEGLISHPVVVQRLLRYPRQSGAVDQTEIGIGAHTDYGLLTVLAQDDRGGLQVQNRDLEWVEAPPIPGTFVVNSGDLLQRLSNDQYVASVHRVVNVGGGDRYSVPFFLDPNFDSVIAPASELVNADAPARYEPIVSGEHKFGRYLDSFPHLRAM